MAHQRTQLPYNQPSRIPEEYDWESLIVDLIEREQWTMLSADVKGDAYEGLLQKNAEDTKSGAGQYFTPRPLIRAMVDVTAPAPGMRVLALSQVLPGVSKAGNEPVRAA